MQTICIKTKLKRGSISEVRSWFGNLRTRMAEVLESLANEGIVVESAFLDKYGDDYYLIYYLKAHEVSHAYEVFGKSTLAIDQYYKDCWSRYCEGRIVLEELFDIDRISST